MSFHLIVSCSSDKYLLAIYFWEIARIEKGKCPLSLPSSRTFLPVGCFCSSRRLLFTNLSTLCVPTSSVPGFRESYFLFSIPQLINFILFRKYICYSFAPISWTTYSCFIRILVHRKALAVRNNGGRLWLERMLEGGEWIAVLGHFQ